MKPFLLFFLLFTLLLISCSSLGPVDPVALHQQAKVSVGLNELDSWLNASESQFSDMKPGVAKGIVWADSTKKQKTPIAVIFLHGYTATRGEIFPSVDLIGKALGANVFYTRYTGHGLGPDGHKDVTVQDWMRDTDQAVEIGKLLGDRVVIVACSTGATLASWFALGPYRDEVSAMVLVSPNLTPKDSMADLLVWPGNELMLKLFMGDYTEYKVHSDRQALFWDHRHHSHSLITMMELTDSLRKVDFKPWKTNTIVFYDPEDQVVNENVTVRLFSQASPDFVKLREVHNAGDPEHHVLAGEIMSPGFTAQFVQESVEFIKKSLGL